MNTRYVRVLVSVSGDKLEKNIRIFVCAKPRFLSWNWKYSIDYVPTYKITRNRCRLRCVVRVCVRVGLGKGVLCLIYVKLCFSAKVISVWSGTRTCVSRLFRVNFGFRQSAWVFFDTRHRTNVSSSFFTPELLDVGITYVFRYDDNTRAWFSRKKKNTCGWILCRWKISAIWKFRDDDVRKLGIFVWFFSCMWRDGNNGVDNVSRWVCVILKNVFRKIA